MKPFKAIGAGEKIGTSVDAYKDGSFLMDWQEYKKNVLLPEYIRYPLYARKLQKMGHGTYVPVDFDGKRVINIPTLKDIGMPPYEWLAGEKDERIAGDEIIARMPQLYQTTLFSKDELKMMFAGKKRLPLTLSMILEKIAQGEDQKFFQGDASKSVVGMIGAETKDLGNPAGAWGVLDSTTNVLTNAVADFNKAIDYFMLQNLADKPIDVIVTSYAMSQMLQHRLPYSGITNKQYLESSLNGGKIYMTNSLMDGGPTTTTNKALFMARDPKSLALISSGIDQEQEKVGLWSWRYGVREKFSVKVLNAGLNQAGETVSKYICWMDGISNAAT